MMIHTPTLCKKAEFIVVVVVVMLMFFKFMLNDGIILMKFKFYTKYKRICVCVSVDQKWGRSIVYFPYIKLILFFFFLTNIFHQYIYV